MSLTVEHIYEDEFVIDTKRLYLPLVFSSPCPKCNGVLERDLSESYLSYPSLNTPQTVSFYCGECHEEWTEEFTLRLSVEFPNPQDKSC